MKAALLVMVHGSPRPAANQDVFAVIELLRERKQFPIIGVGFMELNEPPIPEAIERCVAQGATRVVGVPYFLHAGNHVMTDLVELLEEAQVRMPQVEFLLGNYLGRQQQIDDVIRERVAQAVESGR